MKYVVIGNSAAAVGCIEGIRSVDRAGSITLISDEPHAAYGRPLISYLLMGRTDLAHMNYRPADFYETMGVTAMLGRRAAEIDAENKTVLLEDGERVPYDRLLVATGSRPFLPPMEGIEQVEHRFSFMTLDDALALEQMLTEKSRVFIVGAGLIGMKCAEGIAQRVARIDICDLAPRVLPSVLDDEAAALVQREMERHGCVFHLGTSVKKFEKNAAILENGERIPFDILVTAVGVRPNTELAARAGAAADRGIVIDGSGRTTLENVYAAGDCAESTDLTTGRKGVIAILPNAYLQGRAAGVSMAGGQEEFTETMPMNGGGFFDVHLVTAGSYDGESHITRGENSYRRLVIKDGLLKGFIIVGDVSRAGIYTALIQKRTPLVQVDLELLLEKPQLMLYDRTVREEMLGGKAK